MAGIPLVGDILYIFKPQIQNSLHISVAQFAYVSTTQMKDGNPLYMFEQELLPPSNSQPGFNPLFPALIIIISNLRKGVLYKTKDGVRNQETQAVI